MISPDALVTALPALLATLDRPGDYYGTGAAELPVVRIAVDSVGVLGLPVPTAQAEALRAAAQDAPYGRGPHTLVDTSVRRCGQLDASAVHADDPRWRATVQRIVGDATKALGVAGVVTAELYKLLVYGPGDFFVEHRDTEKAPGMFATLVVALPSPHTGGALVVRHEGREAVIDLCGEDLGVARWAAFYCDCQHELQPLREGFRIALVYNLVRRTKEPARAPDASPVVAQLAEVLRAWTTDPDAPVKVVLPLAHRYTLAELDFSALKNHDAAAAQALVRAGAVADCSVRLAMLSITESGSAEPTWDGSSRSRRYQPDPETYEVVEVIERECTLRAWRAPDGSLDDLGPIAVDDEQEVAPPDALEDAVPDEDELQEATGNGGASFERTYRWAALVVWPRAHELRVVAQGGVVATLAALERFARGDGGRERARAFAAEVIASWAGLRRRGPEAGGDHEKALRLLVTLDERDLISRFLHAVATTGGLAGEEVEAAVDALARLSGDDAQRCATALVEASARVRFLAAARLVRGAAVARRDASMRGPIEALAATFEGAPDALRWGPPPSEERVRGLVELLCAAAAAGGDTLTTLVAKRIVDARQRFALDAVLVPCALALRAERGRPAVEAIAPLLVACADHLTARCALTLMPPTDASRETDGLTCTCADCAGLRAFLRDAKATTWRLKVAQAQRVHVEHMAAGAHVDVAMATERRGSPHTLVCTKTRARYEARVRQRAADTAALATLGVW
jgi:hypothetical protein